MSFVSRLTQSISRTSRDSLALSRAVYGAVLPGKRSHPTSLAATANVSVGERIKAVLLQEARREPSPNSMAISFLKIDKEIGLVKYWGLAEYLRQNQGFFSFSSLSSRLLNQKPHNDGSNSINNASIDENDASKPTNTAATAKVAFMITSSMKRDLVDGLGYQASVVKGMTPQQASLVLHHRLGPDSYEEQISDLETAFAEEQQRQREELEAQRKQQEELEEQQRKQQELEAASSEASTEQTEISSNASVQSTTSVEENNDASPLLLSSALSNESKESSSSSLSSSSSGEDDFTTDTTTQTKIENDADTWYEVVEIKEEGTETNEFRQGLYKDHEEAVLGLETRQYIQRKRDEETQTNKTNRNEDSSDAVSRVTFVLRSVSGKDLD